RSPARGADERPQGDSARRPVQRRQRVALYQSPRSARLRRVPIGINPNLSGLGDYGILCRVESGAAAMGMSSIIRVREKVAIALVLFVQMIDGGRSSSTGQPIAYSELVRQVDEGNVRTVSMATSTSGNSAITGKLDSGEAFHTVAPAGTDIADKMIQKGVAVQ